MYMTTRSDIDLSIRILINTWELQALLGCGHASAVKIGTEAEARVEIGKRVFWNREKIQKYLFSISV